MIVQEHSLMYDFIKDEVMGFPEFGVSPEVCVPWLFDVPCSVGTDMLLVFDSFWEWDVRSEGEKYFLINSNP